MFLTELALLEGPSEGKCLSVTRTQRAMSCSAFSYDLRFLRDQGENEGLLRKPACDFAFTLSRFC
jgi:hypothetical protein